MDILIRYARKELSVRVKHGDNLIRYARKYVLDLCDEKRDLKKKRYKAKGSKQDDSEGSEES